MLVVVCVAVDGLVAVVVSSVVVVLVCANANGATSPQTKAMIVLFTLCLLLISLPPQFVTQGSSGRSLCVNLFARLVLRRFGVFANFIDLSGRREFANVGRR